MSPDAQCAFVFSASIVETLRRPFASGFTRPKQKASDKSRLLRSGRLAGCSLTVCRPAPRSKFPAARAEFLSLEADHIAS
jgi:hypothetical protein